jgi:tetratricopeptide (TPR) repeat protein
MASNTQVDTVAKTTKSRLNHAQVVEYCTSVLRSGKAQTEVGWTARELLIKAYLDQGEIEKDQSLLKELRSRFGQKSQRVSILEGLIAEASGDWAKAEGLYEDILKLNWNNVTAAKRLAAVKRSRGDLAGASKQLNVLINDNQADLESWTEMCDLQMTCGAFEQALYCAEEILIAHPHSYISNGLYAELLLTCAQSTTVDELKTKWLADSRTYFSQSLVLRGEQGCARSAWGLVAYSRTKKPAEKKDELDDQIKQKAVSMLRKIYANSPLKDLVEPVLSQI